MTAILKLTKMDASRYKRRVKSSQRPVSTVDFDFNKSKPKADSSQLVPMLIVKPKPSVKALRALNDFVPTSRQNRIKNAYSSVINNTSDETTNYIAPIISEPLDMELPGTATNLKTVTKSRKGQSSIIRRRILKGSILLIILALISGGFLISKGYIKIHNAFKGNASSIAALKSDPTPSLLKGEGDGRINVLLLGRGGGNHDAPDLTDTILLASVDPVNSTATLISIPRDLWVSVEHQGSMKINAVWETGEFRYLGKVAPGSTNSAAIQAGFENIDKVVSATFGVPINYNVIVDFQAFKQAVDTVGGVTINVPEVLYDPTMAWENNNNPVLAKAGIQTFDGKKALLYVRSRKTSSDFARSIRQRLVILALKTKVDSLGTLSNPIKLSGLVNAFGNNVATDLSISDASRLYSIVKKIPETSIISVGLSDPPNHFITTSSTLIVGQSIDLPTAGLFNYAAIQTFLRTQLKDGYIVKENAKILVLNGTATQGLATSVATQLKTYGYNVVGTGVMPQTGWSLTTLVDLSNNKMKYTKNYLEKRYGVTAQTSMADATIQTNGADFVIILGSNETNTPKT